MLDVLKDIWNSYMTDTEFFILIAGLIGFLVLCLVLYIAYCMDVLDINNSVYDLSDVPTPLLYEDLQCRNSPVPRSAIKAELKRRRKAGE